MHPTSEITTTETLQESAETAWTLGNGRERRRDALSPVESWASGQAAESGDIWFLGWTLPNGSRVPGTICWSGWATWHLSLDPALGVHVNFGLDLGWGKFLVVNWTPTVRWKMQICKGCSGCKGCCSAEKIMMTRPAEYSNEPFIRSYSGRQEAITATCCPKSETSNENWPFKVPDCDI